MKVEKATANQEKPHVGEPLKVDNSYTLEDVIKKHKEGYSITFNGDKDKFLKLDPEELAKLPKQLLVYYNVATAEYYGKLGAVTETIAKRDTPQRTFNYDKRLLDPNEQLKIEGQKKGFEYAWVRLYDGENLKMERKGWKHAQRDDCKTLGNPDGSKLNHFVGSENKPEMGVMLIPTEMYKENERIIKQSSEEFKKATQDSYKESVDKELHKSGVEGFEEIS